MEQEAQLEEIKALRARLAELERQVDDLSDRKVWTPPAYYTAYEVMGGAILGLVGACVSLLFNIVGASLVGKHPLELVRVYMTFGLGEPALTVESGVALSAGIGLYIATGMIAGIPIHMILGRFFRESSVLVRFLASSVIGLLMWLVNFYGLLYWVQPLLFDGRWIVDNIPLVVGAATHLIFTWTMFAAHRWGEFVPHDTHR